MCIYIYTVHNISTVRTARLARNKCRCKHGNNTHLEGMSMGKALADMGHTTGI